MFSAQYSPYKTFYTYQTLLADFSSQTENKSLPSPNEPLRNRSLGMQEAICLAPEGSKGEQGPFFSGLGSVKRLRH
jgi:hypothetical protein